MGDAGGSRPTTFILRDATLIGDVMCGYVVYRHRGAAHPAYAIVEDTFREDTYGPHWGSESCLNLCATPVV